MEPVVRPRTGRIAWRRHRRGHAPGSDPVTDASGPRSVRGAMVALAVSSVSILLAAAAVFLSITRPVDVTPTGPPLPQTVTVTLLAPRAPTAPALDRPGHGTP